MTRGPLVSYHRSQPDSNRGVRGNASPILPDNSMEPTRPAGRLALARYYLRLAGRLISRPLGGLSQRFVQSSQAMHKE
jgi:hypothetical protein